MGIYWGDEVLQFKGAQAMDTPTEMLVGMLVSKLESQGLLVGLLVGV